MLAPSSDAADGEGEGSGLLGAAAVGAAAGGAASLPPLLPPKMDDRSEDVWPPDEVPAASVAWRLRAGGRACGAAAAGVGAVVAAAVGAATEGECCGEVPGERPERATAAARSAPAPLSAESEVTAACSGVVPSDGGAGERAAVAAVGRRRGHGRHRSAPRGWLSRGLGRRLAGALARGRGCHDDVLDRRAGSCRRRGRAGGPRSARGAPPPRDRAPCAARAPGPGQKRRLDWISSRYCSLARSARRYILSETSCLSSSACGGVNQSMKSCLVMPGDPSSMCIAM